MGKITGFLEFEREKVHKQPVPERLDEKDLAVVKTLIQRHFDYTHSAVAWRLLSGWKETVKQLVRVMPVEYRQVLAKQHLDTDEARLASI